MSRGYSVQVGVKKGASGKWIIPLLSEWGMVVDDNYKNQIFDGAITLSGGKSPEDAHNNLAKLLRTKNRLMTVVTKWWVNDRDPDEEFITEGK